MLKRVDGEINPEGAVITIGEADFPVPFPLGLEFNSPAHGNWNIVHTGMLMPEAIQIYVAADQLPARRRSDSGRDECGDRFPLSLMKKKIS